MENLEKYLNQSNDCPIRNVLDRVGDKWSMLVLLILGENEKLRFGELSKMIGDISHKMLTVTLRTLEADGLVQRTIYAEIPPRVEYELSEIGHSLVPLLENLAGWANENLDTIRRSRAKFQA